jgi:hypothetical protein
VSLSAHLSLGLCCRSDGRQTCPVCGKEFVAVAIHLRKSSCGGQQTGGGQKRGRDKSNDEQGPELCRGKEASRPRGGNAGPKPVIPLEQAADARIVSDDPCQASGSNKHRKKATDVHRHMIAASPVLVTAFEDCCFRLLSFFRFDRALFDSSMEAILRHSLDWLKLELAYAHRTRRLRSPKCGGSFSTLGRHMLSALTLSQGVPPSASGVAGHVAAVLAESHSSPLSEDGENEDANAASLTSSPQSIADMLVCMFRGPRKSEVSFFAKHLCGQEEGEEAMSAAASSEIPLDFPVSELITKFYDEHPAHRAAHSRQLFTNGLFQFLQFHPNAMHWAAEFALVEPDCVLMCNHAEIANMLTLYIVPTLSLSFRLQQVIEEPEKAGSAQGTEPSGPTAALVSVSAVRDEFHASLQSLQEQRFMGLTKLELLLQLCAKFSVPSAPTVDAALFNTRDPPRCFHDALAHPPHHPCRASFEAMPEDARTSILMQLQHQTFSCFAASFNVDDGAVTQLRVWSAASTPIEALYVLCHNTASSSAYDQYLIRRFRLPLTRLVAKAELFQCFWTDELLMVIRNFLFSRMKSDAERWDYIEHSVGKQSFSCLKPLLLPSVIDPAVPQKIAGATRKKLIDLLVELSKAGSQQLSPLL